MTSIVLRCIILMQVPVMMKTGAPEADVEKVVLFGGARLQPVISNKCNDVTSDGDCHEDHDGNDQNDSPNRQTHHPPLTHCIAHTYNNPISLFQLKIVSTVHTC